MPGTPKPTIDSRYGSHWTPVVQALHFGQSQQNQANAARPQGSILDQYGNTVELWGSNLSQNVTIGASFGSPGVQVETGIASGVAGRAYQQSLATGNITTTQGSTSATLTHVDSGTFANGMVIGAANVSDPMLGTPTPAIVPGTTMTVSGTSITLSQNAAESGTALFCAACYFTAEFPGAWVPLTLTSGMIAASGYYVPAARIVGDVVQLGGTMKNNSGSAISGVLATMGASFYPSANVLLAGGALNISGGSGGLDYPGSLANGGLLGLDGLTYGLLQ